MIFWKIKPFKPFMFLVMTFWYFINIVKELLEEFQKHVF